MSLQTTTEVKLADHSPKPAVLVNRIDIIDIFRGCALLDILILNIPYFAMEEYYAVPRSQDTSNVNFWVHAVNVIFFDWRVQPFVRKNVK